jgi:hypothetical protein
MDRLRDLREDFNATATRFIEREASAALLLAKYVLLLKFQAKTPEDKGQLVEALTETALKCLEARAKPDYRGWLGSTDQEAMNSLLRTLESADSAGFLSAKAAGDLAQVGLQFVARAESIANINDRNTMTDYARLCLDHADKFQSIVDRRNEEVSTSKAITPARRIVLKKDGP